MANVNTESKTGPTPADWVELITQAERYKVEIGHSQDWANYRDYYRGYFPDYAKGYPSLNYNITFSLARTTIPKVYFRNPYINVSPRVIGRQLPDPGAEITARIVEGIDNWLIQEMNIKKHAKTVVLDTWLCGRGIFKLGFSSQYGYDPQEDMFGFSDDDGEDAVSDKKGNRIEYDSNISGNMPWVRRVDPDFFFVPYGSRDLEDMPWVDHVVIRPTSDVRKDRKYKGVKDLTGTHLDRILLDSNKKAVLDQMQKRVELTEIHEIRDKKSKKLYAIISKEESRRYIRNVDDALQIEGLPFVDLCFNEDPEFYWCPSDARIIEPQQLEINEVRTQAMYHRRLALMKFLVRKDALDKDGMNSILDGGIGMITEVEGGVGEDIIRILQPHIPPDLVQWAEVIRGDARELMGTGRNQAGELSGGRKTATEIATTQAGHESRMDEKRDAMADAITKIMRKVNQMIFSFWSVDRVVKVIGFDASVYWVKYNKEAIAGEYNLNIDIESLAPRTKNVERQELISLIQALANNPRANIDHLLRQLLMGFDYIDATKVLPEAPETAGGQPMEAKDFVQQQNNLIRNPQEMGQRVQKNIGGLGNV